jgi:HEAT repeat protein
MTAIPCLSAARLGEVGAEGARPALKRALRDRAEVVRQAAKEAIDKLDEDDEPGPGEAVQKKAAEPAKKKVGEPLRKKAAGFP